MKLRIADNLTLPIEVVTDKERKPPDPHSGAYMSFEEIGRELGITRGGAWMAYKSAIRKLLRHRRTRRQLELMRELASSKED